MKGKSSCKGVTYIASLFLFSNSLCEHFSGWNFCTKTFTLKRNQYRHVQVQHKGVSYKKKEKNLEPKEPKFDCDICGYKFMYKQSLERHTLAIHEGKKPYKCPSCGFAFGYKRALSRHVANIHG